MHFSRVIRDHTNGNRAPLNELIATVYEDLRKAAGALMRSEKADNTLNATAVIHEAYLRLAKKVDIDWRGRTHFKAIAAVELRRVLVDAGRARESQKRGRGFERITLSDLEHHEEPQDITELSEALEALAEKHSRQSDVVVYRLFGGLSVEETMEVLQVSEATVKRDWTFARAWLAKHLSGSS